jgi:hypothetical protein
MQDASSADRIAAAAPKPASGPAARRTFDVPAGRRAAMVFCGFMPLLHVLAAVAPIAFAVAGRLPWTAVWLTPAILFLAPPFMVRVTTLVSPLGSGAIDARSREFLHWWFTAQCQIVFARFPFLEEVLRVVPGLYSIWLRLWGAKIGSLVFWSPGVTILDRPLVEIGSRVVFGLGVRINPHVLAPDRSGQTMLHVGVVSIGDDALVGGYSLLLPGSSIGAGEITPPHRSLRPFARFARGRQGTRSKEDDPNG